MGLRLKNGDVIVSGQAMYRNGKYVETALDKLRKQQKADIAARDGNMFNH